MSDLIRGRKPLLALIALAVAMAAPATAIAQSNPGVDVYVEQIPTGSGTKATPKRSTPPAARPAPRNYVAPRPAAPAAPVQRYQAPRTYSAPAAPAHKAVHKHKKHKKHHAAAPVHKAKPAAAAPAAPRHVPSAPASASTGTDFGPLALGLALLGITAAVIGGAAVQRRRIADPAV
jgi:hypothetical protein